ncbi:hypothetical protein [Saccharopolyspora flava]|uniref:FbpC C-terminal regulatory nucleotide binding domain-containing protein n=1 Tax=Saccharopolyspora flava TaxID=95161 RepID=A0A1I6TUL3_9PSEU|nr:hypothetical protein [Saccharopolyspora flava]SFS92933.1 hypothetical protein SAMN05660874_04269 [Saccharopolyspora flava]
MNELDRDTELVRARLQRAVADVEPAPDALPTLLSAARRRRAPYRRPTFLIVAAAAVVAVFAGVAVSVQTPTPQPVSVRPGDYLAAVNGGVIASFDVTSGRERTELARIDGGEVTDLAGDADRVYAAVSTADGGRVVEVAAGGQRQLAETADGRALTANGGRLAYADGDRVVVWAGGARRDLPTPGLRVLDLALSGDGRLALLAERGGPAELLLTGPEPTTVEGAERVPTGSCAPLAITGAGRDIAVLEPADCTALDRARVATYAADTGRKIAAGTPFATPQLTAGPVGLSTDVQGRALVAMPGRGQWLVDGAQILPIPLPRDCRVPATF